MIEERLDGYGFCAGLGDEADEARAYVADAFSRISLDLEIVACSVCYKDWTVGYLPGPPNTRINSLLLPPLSEIGIT